MTTPEDILDELGPGVFDLINELRQTGDIKAKEAADELEQSLEYATWIAAGFREEV